MLDSSPQPSVAAGTLVAGRFLVRRKLGTGGSADVFLAEDPRSPGTLYAMKILRPSVRSNSVAQFDREIQLSLKVNHRNVTETLHTIISYNLLGYTMEYVPGGTLFDLIKSRGALSAGALEKLLPAIAEGLAAIHKAGIVHNDLKSANILLTSSLEPKITDFGIAFFAASRPQAVKRMMSPGSVSPEFLNNGCVDYRSDIFSFGVLAYEAATGRSPFVGKSTNETLALRFKGRPAAPHIVNSDCPPAVSRIISRCLSTDPAGRFANGMALASALNEAFNIGLRTAFDDSAAQYAAA